jgi:hypothetical protein
MISKIQKTESKSKIILLTAREDFPDKHNFLEKFREEGIDIDDKNTIYIERSGNLKGNVVSEKKKKIILKYLQTGKYTHCRIIDDDKANVNVLKEITETISEKILQKVSKTHSINENEQIMMFEGFLVDKIGNLKKIFNKKINT